MDYIYALVLGIVEGITEFLPISSTGHLVLASDILGLPATEFWKSFEISIQLGAILSVVALYGRTLLVDWSVIKRLALAFVPTAILGFGFYSLIKEYLLGNNLVVLWSLVIGGILLIVFEYWHKESPQAAEDISRLTYRQCLAVGAFQSVAMIPGVSRSAATILGGLLVGLKRRTIVEFSFLLAVPTMAAATGYDLYKSAGEFSSGNFAVLGVGFAVSFVVALLSIKFLISYIQRHSFVAFGVYRILAAAAFWLLVL